MVIFSFLLSYLVFPNNDISAQREPPEEELATFLCEDVKQIKTLGLTQRKNLTENILEIPIGKSVDFTEYMADILIEQSLIMANAASAEAKLALEVVSTVDQCGQGICNPVCGFEEEDCNGEWKCDSCSPKKQCSPCCGICGQVPADLIVSCPGTPICCCDTCRKCVNKPCSGPLCPLFSDILENIEEQALIVDSAWGRIEDFFSDRFWPIWLYEEQYGMAFQEANKSHILGVLNDYVAVPSWLQDAICVDAEYCSTNADAVAKGICFRLSNQEAKKNFCITPIEFNIVVPRDNSGKPETGIEGYLDKARTRLADCAVRPHDIESAMRGEIAGEFLFSCQGLLDSQVPVHSFINRIGSPDGPQDECYGNLYCKAMIEGGKPTRYEETPCADDYFCCYY